MDGKTGKIMPMTLLSEAGVQPFQGGHVSFSRSLKPGRNVEFFVRLKLDAAPKNVGTVYCVEQGWLARKVEPIVTHIRGWLKLKVAPANVVELWCSTPLAVRALKAPELTNGSEIPYQTK
jgi:hypothetical protein